MKLNLIERWMLANQLQILEFLTPDEGEKADFAYKRKAIEGGFEIGNEPFMGMCPEDEVVTEEECREVLNILSMFRAIDNSFAKGVDKEGIDIDDLRFQGFDGNEETKQYSFADYFCIENPDKRFNESFPKGEMINSHSPTLDMYRRMMGAWQQSADKNHLSKEDLLRILRARPYPREL